MALTTRLRSEQLPSALGVNIAPGATGTISSSAGHFERSRTAAMGVWTPVAYSAGNFTPSGAMTWTVDAGDQVTFQFMLVGTTLFVDITLDTTTVGGTPSNVLSIAIPGGFSAAKAKQTPCIIFDNTTTAFEFGLARVLAAGTTIDVLRLGLANFSASVNNTYLRVGINFEV